MICRSGCLFSWFIKCNDELRQLSQAFLLDINASVLGGPLMGSVPPLLFDFCWSRAGKMLSFGSVAVVSLLDFCLDFSGHIWAGLMVDRQGCGGILDTRILGMRRQR